MLKVDSAVELDKGVVILERVGGWVVVRGAWCVVRGAWCHGWWAVSTHGARPEGRGGRWAPAAGRIRAAGTHPGPGYLMSVCSLLCMVVRASCGLVVCWRAAYVPSWMASVASP